MADYDLMDRLIATAKIRLPTVTTAALNLELFNVIDEFFRETSAWRYEAVVPLIAGDTRFPIFAPSGTSLVQVMGASHNGRTIQSVDGSQETTITQRGSIVGIPTPPDYDTLYSPGETGTSGGVYAFSIFYPSYITVTVPPSADAAQFPISALLALTLSADNLAGEPNEWPLEPWMPEAFHEAWINGIQSRMMSQIGKPYSNPTLAAVHEKKFRQLKGRAKQVANRGYQYNTPRWKFPAWGGQGR